MDLDFSRSSTTDNVQVESFNERFRVRSVSILRTIDRRGLSPVRHFLESLEFPFLDGTGIGAASEDYRSQEAHKMNFSDIAGNRLVTTMILILHQPLFFQDPTKGLLEIFKTMGLLGEFSGVASFDP